MPRRPRSVEERWSAKVDTSGGPDACHPWTGALFGGYGHIMLESQRDIGAHVYAWIRTHGPIPAGQHVDHECHNRDLTCPGGRTCPHRACCNERHLRLATPGENVLAGRSPALSSERITIRNQARKGGPRQGGRLRRKQADR